MDFPDPVAPTIARVPPAGAVKLTCSRTHSPGIVVAKRDVVEDHLRAATTRSALPGAPSAPVVDGGSSGSRTDGSQARTSSMRAAATSARGSMIGIMPSMKSP